MALADRYSYLGASFQEAAEITKRRPWVFIEQFFSAPNFPFFRNIFLISGGTWTFAGMALIPMAPVFFEIALSTYSPSRNLNSHYIIPILGALFYCSCVGIQKISLNENLSPHLKTIITMAVLLSLWPLEYSEPANIKYILNSEGFKNRKCYAQLLTQIPEDAAVYANDPFTTHIANRPVVLKYLKLRQIDIAGAYVIFEETDPAPFNTEVVGSWCGYKLARRH